MSDKSLLPPLPIFLTSYEALNERADEASFVVIGGIPLDVDELVDAIHGREIDPTLTRAELTTVFASDERGAFFERVEDGIDRRISGAKAEKKRRIEALIQKSTVGTDLKLPRREQILIALSKGKLHYSSLAEFLGQFAELNEADAALVADAVSEVRGDLLDAQAPSRISSRRMSQCFSEGDLQLIERTLGVQDLNAFPIFLLERALFDHPPHPDDYKYFEEIRPDRGVRFGFSVEAAASTVAFAAPLFAFAGSIIAAERGYVPWENLDGIVQPLLYVMSAGALAKSVSFFTGWSPITNRLRATAHDFSVRNSGKELENGYHQLEQAITVLRTKPLGFLYVLWLREAVLAKRQDVAIGHVPEVAAWITELQNDPQRVQAFDDFSHGVRSGGSFETFEVARMAMAEFTRYEQGLVEVIKGTDSLVVTQPLFPTQILRKQTQ